MAVLSILDPELAAPTRVDRTISQQLADAMPGHDGECYGNSLCALPRLVDATYVEGFVVSETGLRFEHAWLETPAGVVDPTPAYAAMAEGACIYFAGPRWTLNEIHALFSPGHDDIATPILGYDFTDTPHRRAWIAAVLAAFRHLSALHVQHTGRPAIPRDEDEATLECLLGCFWAKRVLCAHATSPERPPSAAVSA